MQRVAAPEFVRPAHFWSPPRASSGGAEAIDVAAGAGLVLDPWQAWTLEQVLGETADGELAAFEAGIVVPRQNGKGSCLEALALYWLFVEEVELVLWSAHEFKTAAEAFRRMRILLQGAPDLWPLVARITTANGDEAVELVTGQRLKFVARSKASGRGFTGDKIILDEAYDLDEDQIAALIPTLATRPDPQIIYTSSAGMSDSHTLRAVRDRGRAGGDASLCWLEWCATPSGKDENGNDVYDLDDRGQWTAANPGYPVRISPGFIAKERRAMTGEKFARERLGVWDEPDVVEKPISTADWDATKVSDDHPVPAGAPVFFLDVSPGMRSAAIAVAAAGPGGTPHVELADHRQGSDWLVARAVELAGRHPDAHWAYDAAGGVGVLLPELQRAGIEPEPFNGPEMGRACGHLQKLTADRAFSHSDDPLLLVALGGAVKRDVGEGLWAWAKRKATVDISPLVAETGALWLLEKHADDDYDLMDSFG